MGFLKKILEIPLILKIMGTRMEPLMHLRGEGMELLLGVCHVSLKLYNAFMTPIFPTLNLFLE